MDFHGISWDLLGYMMVYPPGMTNGELLKITIYIPFTHWTWWFSMVFWDSLPGRVIIMFIMFHPEPDQSHGFRWIKIPGWWFGTWILFSISYMGCHPSHWFSYFSRWLKPPTRYSFQSSESIKKQTVAVFHMKHHEFLCPWMVDRPFTA